MTQLQISHLLLQNTLAKWPRTAPDDSYVVDFSSLPASGITLVVQSHCAVGARTISSSCCYQGYLSQPLIIHCVCRHTPCDSVWHTMSFSFRLRVYVAKNCWWCNLASKDCRVTNHPHNSEIRITSSPKGVWAFQKNLPVASFSCDTFNAW